MTATGTKPATPAVQIADSEGAVTVQKRFTRMGERLEVRAGSDSSIRMDAIMLESVAWQDPEDLAEKAAAIEPSLESQFSADRDDAGEQRDGLDGPITISSEYARAAIDVADDGSSIEITAPKLGYDIEIGPAELAWLATQTHERFSEWLETPFGPGGDDHDHGH
jgi:hypothetical protein